MPRLASVTRYGATVSGCPVPVPSPAHPPSACWGCVLLSGTYTFPAWSLRELSPVDKPTPGLPERVAGTLPSNPAR